tara:strand:+ start:38 stop:223 length:186 start_codon:yes stop_codon:yes gene_type:complete
MNREMKKLREYEYFILILVGLIMIVLDYINYGSIDDSTGLLFITMGLIILFGKRIWRNNYH